MLQLFSMSMISKLKSFQKFDSTNNCISLRRIVADIKCVKNRYAYWSKISRLQIRYNIICRWAMKNNRAFCVLIY